MTTFTEVLPHAGGFLVSEAPGTRSREVAEIAAGQTLAAGTVVQLADSKLTAFTADTNTAGSVITAACGVVINDGVAGEEVAYIARDAEVNLAELTYPDETTGGNEEANTIASLAALGIIAR
jgi:phosphoglycerate dehydrogenase-like enzyme